MKRTCLWGCLFFCLISLATEYGFAMRRYPAIDRDRYVNECAAEMKAFQAPTREEISQTYDGPAEMLTRAIRSRARILRGLLGRKFMDDKLPFDLALKDARVASLWSHLAEAWEVQTGVLPLRTLDSLLLYERPSIIDFQSTKFIAIYFNVFDKSYEPNSEFVSIINQLFIEVVMRESSEHEGAFLILKNAIEGFRSSPDLLKYFQSLAGQPPVSEIPHPDIDGSGAGGVATEKVVAEDFPFGQITHHKTYKGLDQLLARAAGTVYGRLAEYKFYKRKREKHPYIRTKDGEKLYSEEQKNAEEAIRSHLLKLLEGEFGIDGWAGLGFLYALDESNLSQALDLPQIPVPRDGPRPEKFPFIRVKVSDRNTYQLNLLKVGNYYWGFQMTEKTLGFQGQGSQRMKYRFRNPLDNRFNRLTKYTGKNGLTLKVFGSFTGHATNRTPLTANRGWSPIIIDGLKYDAKTGTYHGKSQHISSAYDTEYATIVSPELVDGAVEIAH